MAKFDLNDYVDVQTRINDFWKQYPDGAILTTLLSDPGDFDRVVVQATVYKHRDDKIPSGSDIAAEEKGKNGMANTTSWHENCATSAIGRALADIGMAKSQKDRPSRQEMEKVERTPSPTPNPIHKNNPASDKQKNLIRGLWKDCGHTTVDSDGVIHHNADTLRSAITNRFGPNASIDNLDIDQAKRIIDALQDTKRKREEAGNGTE